jgi:hypothetical protein
MQTGEAGGRGWRYRLKAKDRENLLKRKVAQAVFIYAATKDMMVNSLQIGS